MEVTAHSSFSVSKWTDLHYVGNVANSDDSSGAVLSVDASDLRATQGKSVSDRRTRQDQAIKGGTTSYYVHFSALSLGRHALFRSVPTPTVKFLAPLALPSGFSSALIALLVGFGVVAVFFRFRSRWCIEKRKLSDALLSTRPTKGRKKKKPACRRKSGLPVDPTILLRTPLSNEKGQHIDFSGEDERLKEVTLDELLVASTSCTRNHHESSCRESVLTTASTTSDQYSARTDLLPFYQKSSNDDNTNDEGGEWHVVVSRHSRAVAHKGHPNNKAGVHQNMTVQSRKESGGSRRNMKRGSLYDEEKRIVREIPSKLEFQQQVDGKSKSLRGRPPRQCRNYGRKTTREKLSGAQQELSIYSTPVRQAPLIDSSMSNEGLSKIRDHVAVEDQHVKRMVDLSEFPAMGSLRKEEEEPLEPENNGDSTLSCLETVIQPYCSKDKSEKVDSPKDEQQFEGPHINSEANEDDNSGTTAQINPVTSSSYTNEDHDLSRKEAMSETELLRSQSSTDTQHSISEKTSKKNIYLSMSNPSSNLGEPNDRTLNTGSIVPLSPADKSSIFPVSYTGRWCDMTDSDLSDGEDTARDCGQHGYYFEDGPSAAGGYGDVGSYKYSNVNSSYSSTSRNNQGSILVSMSGGYQQYNHCCLDDNWRQSMPVKAFDDGLHRGSINRPLPKKL